MAMTENGISTTTALGQEQYEYFTFGRGRSRKRRCQYDYRDTDGELFSCVTPTLEEARTRRDAWLEKKAA